MPSREVTEREGEIVSPILAITVAGGGLGVALGLAEGRSRAGERVFRYGALGTLLGLMGGLVYVGMISRPRPTDERASSERESLLSARMRGSHAAPTTTRGIGRAGWDRSLLSAVHLSPMIPMYPFATSYRRPQWG